MATTTNFGWSTPDDTSLVKDGAAAIRTLGQSIDTSMADLEGGTTGQFLAKASNTDMDFTWTTPVSGGLTLLATTTLSGSATTVSSISGSYKNLLFVIKNIQQSIDDNGALLTLNGDSGANYQFINYRVSNTTLSIQSNNDSTAIDNFFNSSTSGTSPANLGTAVINLYRYTDTDVVQGDWRFSVAKNDGTPSGTQGQFSYNCSAAVTSLTLTTYSGTFSGGTIYTYGVN